MVLIRTKTEIEVNTYASEIDSIDELIFRSQRVSPGLELPPNGQRERFEGVRVLPNEPAKRGVRR